MRSVAAPALRLPALVVVTAALALAGLFVGARWVAPAEVVGALTGAAGAPASASSRVAHDVVIGTRLPRTVVALAAGLALGMAGHAVRALTRNPIADPGLLGVSSGAALGVALVAIGEGARGGGGGCAAVVAAVAGAVAASALVTRVGLRGRGDGALSTTLFGFCVGVACLAVVSALSLLDPVGMASLQGWRTGSLALVDLSTAALALPVAATGALLLVTATGSTRALELGDDVATVTGAHPARTRAVLLLAVAALAGSAVAVAGPISFVGLVATHVARRVRGRGRTAPLVAAGLAGAALLCAVDVLGRVAPGPGEVPAGIGLAFVGGPLLIALLVCHQRRLRRPAVSR